MRALIYPVILAVVGLGLGIAQADIITSADTGPAGNTYTTGDGLVTLNAYSTVGPLTPGIFSVASWIGVDGGASLNHVDDGDGDPATEGDREAIDMVLDATVGFSQIVFEWTRADGPLSTDGVQIAGFTSDPGAVLTLGTGTVTYDAGSLFVSLPWTGFATVDVANLGASAGQTLRISTNDSDEALPQAAIATLSYDVIPEPSTLALLVVGASLALARRRR